MAKYQVIKAEQLPSPSLANTVYYIKGKFDSEVKAYVTDSAGTAFPLIGTPLRTAGDTGVGALRYAGTTRTAGQLYGGVTAPTSLTNLNYDGILTATRFSPRALGSYSIKETSVGTTAVVIADDGSYGGSLHIVSSKISEDDYFTDLVLQHFDNITVVSSLSTGSPPTRTYSSAGTGALGLSLSSGTLTVKVSSIINFDFEIEPM